MGITPVESGEADAATLGPPISEGSYSGAVKELWGNSGAGPYDLSLEKFNAILLEVGSTENYGLPLEQTASPKQQTVFFARLRLPDLVLARACAEGNAVAWEHFLAFYREPLVRSAVFITGSETLGRETADSLYAELYGLHSRDGQRHSPLNSYAGMGSLISWLRTVLAQRHVDRHRRRHRETPLDDFDAPVSYEESNQPHPAIPALSKAIEQAIGARPPEDRFLLTAYYLDGRTLRQVGELLSVSESTISRRLGRLEGKLRKEILNGLQASGLSRRAAEEALGADPRDLELNLKKLLQDSPSGAFLEKVRK
jgi:RNA polymerase sigma-70 factor (ECF subfamily)